MKFRIAALILLLILSLGSLSVRAAETPATVIYDDLSTNLANADQSSGQLWITTADLKRATRFELKPQGVCQNELCFPIPKSREAEFVRKRANTTWFNLVAFAQLVRQPVAHDQALSAWYFGLRADQRQGLSSLEAPDFTLPDMNGKPHSLSDFRGKKVLLLTWASW